MIIDKLDALLRLKGTNITQFAKANNIKQTNLSQKGKRNSYYLKEGIMIADYTHTKLAFIDENNNPLIIFDADDLKENND